MNALGWVGQASWAKAYFVKYQTRPFQKLPYFPNLLSLFIRNTHNDWQGRAENGATCKIAPFQPVASIGGLLSVRQRGGLGAGVVSDQLCFISIVREAGAVLCLRLLTQLSLALRSHILKTPSHPRIKGFQRRMHMSVKGIFIFSNILVVALRIYLAQ